MIRTVKIGPSFFAKAKNDYACWRFAIAREFLQNSIDAGATRVEIGIDGGGGETTVTVEDNGCGMSDDVLFNKLLALGESGKDFAGTVGGFGKAKEILYFCHNSYRIETGNTRVDGSGGEYNVTHSHEDRHYVKGTRSEICMRDTDETGNLNKAFTDIIGMTQWRGSFVLNGKEVVGRLKKGAFRKELDWCKLYTNRTFVNRLIVRIGGIVMFTKYVEADDRCVIVELKGNSSDVLQSSRDTLKFEQRCELDELIRKLTVDKKSAFRSDIISYEHYSGDKLQNDDSSEKTAMQALHNELAGMQDEVVTSVEEEENTAIVAIDSAPRLALHGGADATRVDVRTHFRHDFVVKNNLGMVVPEYYKPGEFSKYSDKLVRSWVRLLLETYRTFGRCEPFSVGFIFEEQVLAEFEQTPQYGRVFYINPTKTVKNSTGQRSLKRRWGFTWNMKYQLIVTAVHEYVHSTGFGYHDERFVSKSDDCMAVVLKNLPRFRKCFV